METEVKPQKHKGRVKLIRTGDASWVEVYAE
jgi:hypothetical protein